MPPMSELAARYWVQLLSGERTLPPNAASIVTHDRLAEEHLFARDAARLTSLSQFQRWMNELAELIGCKPQLHLLRLNHPRVWDRVMHSAFCGLQFRLHGPGASDAAWRAVGKLLLPSYRRQPRCAVLAKLRSLREFDNAESLHRSWLWKDSAPFALHAEPHAAPMIDVSIATNEDIVAAICEAATGAGLLRFRGVGSGDALLATQSVFNALNEHTLQTVDAGVSFKGAWLDDSRRPGSSDLKLVIDLESAQLGTADSRSLFPDLCATPGLQTDLSRVLSFLDEANRHFMPLIHEALARVVGDGALRHEASHAMIKYRLCDYPEHPPCGLTNRCSAHTDYGTATLIFEDGSPGLEIWVPQEQQWQEVPPGERGDALLLFGWCSCVRSNGRAVAHLHRVATKKPAASGVVPRRTSLVLFAAPPPQATLNPVLIEPDERPKYRSSVAGTSRTQAMRAHRQE